MNNPLIDAKRETIESIQKAVAKLLATHPAGHELCLIGGFRYRLLNQSARMSLDVDYHWAGDFGQKQAEIIKLFRSKLVPAVSRKLNLQGEADAATGPDAQSPAVRIVNLAFWQPDVAYSRIEIPVEITRILCADKITVRTADGVIYPTPSDMDVIESKVIAIFNRPVLEYRDIVDLFLFSSHLGPESPGRLREKFKSLSIETPAVRKLIKDLESESDYHIRSLERVVASQLAPDAAANLRSGGGARMVHQTTLTTLRQLLGVEPEGRA